MNDDIVDIQACINGDTNAYRNLIQRYEPEISRLMWRFTRNTNECESLVQDVFVEAYLNLKSYRGRAPFIHWLRTIGTRVGYLFWKERARSSQVISLDEFDRIGPEIQLQPEEAAEVVFVLLARLPHKDRLVLTLMYLDNCDVSEIAHRLGWTRAAVKMRLMRARNKIKKMANDGLLEKLGWIY